MMLRKLYYLRKALQNQRNHSVDKIKKLKLKLFRDILKYSYRNVPYYKKQFKKVNFNPNNFNSLKKIKNIPVLTKKEILNNFNELQNKNIPVKLCRNTSGSSGFPLKVNYDSRAVDFSDAIYFRSMINSKVRLLEKGAYFWAKPFPDKKIYNYNLINKKFIYTADSTQAQIKKIKLIKPSYWYIFPSNLKLISKELEVKDYKINLPDKIICTGEILDAKLKHKLEEKFNCKIYNHYGTQELNRMAASCSYSDSLHMDEDSIYFEFDKENEEITEKEKGEIILTGFFNYRMPLIRYKVGDYATLEEKQKCSCGNSFRRIKTIIGRNDDIIKSDKKEISPRAITGLFDEKYLFSYKIHSYKLIQKTKSYFELFIVKGNKFYHDTEKSIKHDLKKIISEEIKVKVIYANNIPLNKGGKHRYIKSNL